MTNGAAPTGTVTSAALAEGAIDGARGLPVVLADGRTYLVPPFTLGQLAEHKGLVEHLRAPFLYMGQDDHREKLERLVDALHVALARNYPDLTREQVLDLVDMRNALELIAAIQGANGFRELRERFGLSP